MVPNSVVIQSAQLSRAGIKQQVLKDGNSVLVRVIADKGNGKYTGSVAGVRVNLTSSKPVEVGSTFVAKISAKDGVIYVTPKTQDIRFVGNVEINAANNLQLSNFLESLGVASDSLYVNIMQQMKQLEMKLDAQLMYKLHNLSVRFKGKEKRASEILVNLIKKNVQIEEKEILQLLQFLDEYENDSEGFESENGKKLLNKINKTDKGWYVLPYELYNLRDDAVLGKGCMNLLFDSADNLKLLNLNCNYKDKKYLFSLIFENKICKNIRFNINPFDVEKVEREISLLREKFIKADIGLSVSWAEAFEIEGTSCESEEIYAVGGMV